MDVRGRIESLKRELDELKNVLDQPKGIPKGRKHMILFYWDKISLNRGAFLNTIYGFNLKRKRHKGLIEQYNGIKTGKSSVIFPIEYKDEVIKLLKKYKVDAKNMEVFI